MTLFEKILVGYLVVEILATIAFVGRRRTVITPESAAVTTLILLGFIFGLLRWS